MKLSQDSEIASIKITQYLLKTREEDDKSKYLAGAGYTAAHAERLLGDLRGLLTVDAEFIQVTDYGDKYRIRGILKGPNGRTLHVVSIWMIERATGQTKFVTLYPD